MKALVFQTGRNYTDQGQRIAATRIESGEIVLVDIDRHIDIMLPAGVALNQAEVMQAYDHNLYIFPNDVGLPYDEYYEIVNKLREAAAVEGVQP